MTTTVATTGRNGERVPLTLGGHEIGLVLKREDGYAEIKVTSQAVVDFINQSNAFSVNDLSTYSTEKEQE